MKTKIIALLFVLFVLVPVVFAQNKTINIECNLAINETEWIKDSQIIATLILKNNSDEEVEINLPPFFILEIPNRQTNRTGIIYDEEYSSREKFEDHIIIKRTKYKVFYKTRQFFSFSLKSGESRSVEFNLTNLAWDDRMSSIRADIGWYNRIPSGDFNLYYEWGYALDKNKVAKRSIKIISNKIAVKLKSKK